MSQRTTKAVTLESLPEFIAIDAPSAHASEGPGHAVSAGSTSVGRMFSDAVDVSNHTDYSLAVYFSNQINDVKSATKRAGHMLGRIYNAMTASKPYYVRVSGHHLKQIAAKFNADTGLTNIAPQGQYGIRVDIAEAYFEELTQRLQAKATAS